MGYESWMKGGALATGLGLRFIANCMTDTKTDEELKTITEMEKVHIQKVLLRAPSMEEAAGVLGIDPATLWRKRKKYNLE